MKSEEQYDMEGIRVENHGEIGRNIRRCHASALIGPEGGLVAITDPESPIAGTTLSIPAGALDTPALISIAEGMHSCNFACSPSIHLQPNGLRFKRSAILKVHLKAPALNDSDAAGTAFYHFDEAIGDWFHDGRAGLNRIGNIVFCSLLHL